MIAHPHFQVLVHSAHWAGRFIGLWDQLISLFFVCGMAVVEAKKNLKVVHVGYSDHDGAGGTGIALFRLHRALVKAGHQSHILSSMKSVRTNESESITRSASELLLRKITVPLGLT